MNGIYKKVIALAHLIRRYGGRAMLVGGCVRDELMGITPKDWDVEVYGIPPDKLKRLLEDFAAGSADTPVRKSAEHEETISADDRDGEELFAAGSSDTPVRMSAEHEETISADGRDGEELFAAGGDVDKSVHTPLKIVGEAFAVYKLGNDLDVGLPRREQKTGRGHRGFVVEGDPNMSFEEACSRRDLTVNAILKDPLTGEIVDPFNGRQDLEQKLLRHVSDATFAEDSLRVLRVCQFAARFEFDIHPETAAICKGIDVTDLPKERIWGEIEKMLLLAQQPSIGIKNLYDLGVADQLFPELVSLVGVPQEPEWHPEGDVDIHTMMVADEARRLIDDLPYERKVAVMLGALCHDLGKPSTTEFLEGRIRSRGHDEAGVEPTLSLLDTLGIFTLNGFDVREQVVQLVRYHLKPGEFYNANKKSPIGDGGFRRLARKVEPDLLYRVAKADSLGRYPDGDRSKMIFGSEAQEWFIERIRELKIEKKAPDPILMGRHLIELGMKPGRDFKRILDAVYELQLDGAVSDLETAIIEAKNLTS